MKQYFRSYYYGDFLYVDLDHDDDADGETTM